jgi:hypothetical protein
LVLDFLQLSTGVTVPDPRGLVFGASDDEMWSAMAVTATAVTASSCLGASTKSFSMRLLTSQTRTKFFDDPVTMRRPLEHIPLTSEHILNFRNSWCILAR